MMDPSIFISLAIAFAACLVVVPVAKAMTQRLGLVDHPDKKRKLHSRAIPLAGGISIYASLIFAVLFTGLIAGVYFDASWFVLDHYSAILVGGSIILAVGLYDDRFGMRGRTKLLGQCLAITAFLSLGTFDYQITLFGFALPIWLGIPLIVIWLIGTINAVNLIDGADGVASTIGGIASIALVIIALCTGSLHSAILAAAMAGAIAAFLLYNFPPASTFLGDTGSMLIGFLVGAVAISCSSQAASLLMVAPMAILLIPLFDSFVAILRRRLTGRSIYSVDRGHIHHALMANGYGPKQMLALIACLSIVGAIGGCVSALLESSIPAVISVSLVLGYLVIGRVFGSAEFALLTVRIISIGSTYVASHEKEAKQGLERKVHLQGSRNWGQLWDAITEFAERHQMAQVRLDLNLPWLHEGFHATWQRPIKVDRQECWKTGLPLTANGRTFGRLEIVAPLTRSSVYSQLSQLSELLESMESVILRLANEDHAPMAMESSPNTSIFSDDSVATPGSHNGSDSNISPDMEPVGSNA